MKKLIILSNLFLFQIQKRNFITEHSEFNFEKKFFNENWEFYIFFLQFYNTHRIKLKKKIFISNSEIIWDVYIFIFKDQKQNYRKICLIEFLKFLKHVFFCFYFLVNFFIDNFTRIEDCFFLLWFFENFWNSGFFKIIFSIFPVPKLPLKYPVSSGNSIVF